MNTASKSIFITGAAAGIGRACAIRFARQGWFVGLYDTDLTGVQNLATELGSNSCTFAALDVTQIESFQNCLLSFFEIAGRRLDVLLNNAGILRAGDFSDIPIVQQSRMIDVNIKGVLHGCHAAFPYLQQTPGSCVVNMASASALYGQPSLATYSCSKFAVRGLTEALNLEWEGHGIRVVDIWPVFVQTAMVQDMNVRSIEALGVHLSADDVADSVWKAAISPGSFVKVHWLVGMQTWFLAMGTKISPAWLNRWITRLVSMNQVSKG